MFGNDYPTHDGTGVRDYIHVVDLARGHVAACNYLMQHSGCEVFNLGTGTGYSVLDLVNTFERVNGIRIPYVIVDRRPAMWPAATRTPPRPKICLAGRRKRRWTTCAAIPGVGRAIIPTATATRNPSRKTASGGFLPSEAVFLLCDQAFAL